MNSDNKNQSSSSFSVSTIFKTIMNDLMSSCSCCCLILISLCIASYRCADIFEFIIAGVCPCYYFCFLLFHQMRNIISPCVKNVVSNVE